MSGVILKDLAAIVIPAPVRATWREYFQRTHDDREPLKVLGKPCHDCAVTTGFYEPYAEALAREDIAFQDRIASRWFCHNHCNRACRGVADYLAARTLSPKGGETDV